VTGAGGGRVIRESVEHRIRDLISCGQLDDEGRLPTERDLADMFGVSRATVRQVLDRLEHAGLVHRRRGRTGGTFVTRPRIDLDFGQIAGVPAYLRAQGFRPGVHVVSARMISADSITADALHISRGSLVHDIIRVRLADDVRISLEHGRFPVSVFPDMLDERLDSIYELMAQRYGQVVVKAVERLLAVLADEEQARLLGISVGDPLMAIERVSYDKSGRPLEYSTDLFRGDRTRVIAWAPGPGQPGQGFLGQPGPARPGPARPGPGRPTAAPRSG
jgi:GntR family transcriptional regulator